ncbi:hypothetical protein Rhal01_00046 [Rubritalea halochordaticola]|uniref:Uncharacterized protein n=2 Tax=Rubritalea halochordaticola TaxID=714537 RepID=A0ABP9UX04_9BACT
MPEKVCISDEFLVRDLVMSDTFTTSTTTGWFSRIGDSIKGILFGLLLIVISFPLLFWNEGRAVKTRKSLDQGSNEVVSLTSTTPDSANNGKLVHLTGEATTEQVLKDEKYNISTQALVLKRTVEMYQWQEDGKTETKKKLGGSEETITTYSYNKVWHEGRIDSSSFHKSAEYKNPMAAEQSQSLTADPITVGGFTLSDPLKSKLSDFTPLPIQPVGPMPETIVGKKVTVSDQNIYLGADPSNPALGDLRISYSVVTPGEISIISKQKDQSFESYTADAGGKINMLVHGNQSAASMFEAAHQSNKVMTWVLRAVGFIVMWIGFGLLFAPLSVIADVIPLAGSIVGAGTSIIAFLLSLPLSLCTIAVAWIFYRPLIGIPLIVLAVGFFVLLIVKLKKARA